MVSPVLNTLFPSRSVHVSNLLNMPKASSVGGVSPTVIQTGVVGLFTAGWTLLPSLCAKAEAVLHSVVPLVTPSKIRKVIGSMLWVCGANVPKFNTPDIFDSTNTNPKSDTSVAIISFSDSSA